VGSVERHARLQPLLSQDFGDDRYQVRAGQIAADSSFMAARYAGLFVNAAYGDIPTENVNTNTPVYPLAAPGSTSRASPTMRFTFRSGLYTGDAGRDVSGNHGFGWKLGNNAGYGFYEELTLHTEPGGLEGNYTLGGYYVAGSFPVIGTDETRYGTYNVYVHARPCARARRARQGEGRRLRALQRVPQKDRNPGFIYGDVGLNVLRRSTRVRTTSPASPYGILRASDHDSSRRAVRAARSPARPGRARGHLSSAVTTWLTIQPDMHSSTTASSATATPWSSVCRRSLSSRDST
jgi:hypothetical protein